MDYRNDTGADYDDPTDIDDGSDDASTAYPATLRCPSCETMNGYRVDDSVACSYCGSITPIDVPRVTDAERKEAVGIAFVTVETLAWDAEPTDDDYAENGPDGIVYSHTIPCGMCGEIHPC